MANLSLVKPKDHISTTATPEAIQKAVKYIFANCGEGVWLVGGTALAGFYAEHRRSDDIDLFTANADAQYATVLAIKSIQAIGAFLGQERQTPLYYRAEIKYLGHKFTAEAVLDEHLHRIGGALLTKDGICVADLPTLFAMKTACLVSRCSEKDLFDLDWIFAHIGSVEPAKLVEIGAQIDGGISVESLLISIQGAVLRKEGCHFLLPKSDMTVDVAYRKISALRKKLAKSLLEYEKTLPPAPETEALRQNIINIKKLQRY